MQSVTIFFYYLADSFEVSPTVTDGSSTLPKATSSPESSKIVWHLIKTMMELQVATQQPSSNNLSPGTEVFEDS